MALALGHAAAQAELLNRDLVKPLARMHIALQGIAQVDALIAALAEPGRVGIGIESGEV